MLAQPMRRNSADFKIKSSLITSFLQPGSFQDDFCRQLGYIKRAPPRWESLARGTVIKMDKDISEILGSIDELAKRGKISRNRAFAAWFAINFFDVDEDEALESAAVDGGNDQGIDIVFSDESSQEIVILQAHCPENMAKKTPKNKWDAVVSCLPYVRDTSHLRSSGRPDLAELIDSIKESYPDYTYAVGLISLGLKSIEIDSSRVAHEQDSENNNTTFFYFSQEYIRARFKSLVESEAGIPEDELKFCGNCFEDAGEYGRAWIGSVSAPELARLHTAHQDKLFAGNVRLFLGSRKGGINEQIIKTAQETPGQFWALNNGITIVADSAVLSEDGSSLRLKRFSIVNGCQTTSSLVKAKADSSAKVLARVIAAKVGLKNEIVRFNNSQNAVKIWTVRAVDDIQEDLRRDLRAIGIEYAPKQSGSRRKKNPSIIELDKVTQFLASSDQKFLIQAIDNKSELFDEPYQKLFKRGIQASVVYLAWLTGNAAEHERQVLADGLKDDENAGLLGVTSSYWIVYTTYKILDKSTDLSSPHITLARMKSPEFSNALGKYVSRAATMFYDAAVDTYSREEYGSFKSTLRSAKFLQKIESKLNTRIIRLKDKPITDLAIVCKSIKLN